MNFYVIEISSGDAKIAGRSIYSYPTEKDAVASFHSKLGTAMKSAMYTDELVMVIDSYGAVIKKEMYCKPDDVAEEPAE